jgi:hypothetical protein
MSCFFPELLSFVFLECKSVLDSLDKGRQRAVISSPPLSMIMKTCSLQSALERLPHRADGKQLTKGYFYPTPVRVILLTFCPKITAFLRACVRAISSPELF